jgi:hypothetical protein
VYHTPQTVFDRLEDENIDVPEEDRYYPYRATYDIELMLQPTEIVILLKKHPHSRPVFKGVYARNRLPRLLNVPSALVGNTDPDH